MKTLAMLGLGAAFAISITIGVAQPTFTVDPHFNPIITHAAGRMNSVSVQGDGGIYVAGAFDAIDGVPRKGVARLNAAGGLDPSFAAELSAEGIEINAKLE